MKKNAALLIASAILIIGLFSFSAGQGGWMTAPGGPLARPTPAPTQADSSDEIAKKIVDSKKPVLIDFWAVWCRPCRMLSPTITKLEEEYKNKVLFLRVNVDYNPRLSSYFQIQGIPAVFIVKDRSVVQALVGLHEEEEYRTALNQALAMSPEKEKKDTTGAGAKTADSVKTKKAVKQKSTAANKNT